MPGADHRGISWPQEKWMKIPYYHVDAFADRQFAGNPAGVCLLENWLADEIMQKIAGENRHSETAFLVKNGENYDIRWFTPLAEVKLCGHATLAGAHVLFNHLGYALPVIHFNSKSGILRVEKTGDILSMDFPAYDCEEIQLTPQLVEALGEKPSAVYRARSLMAVFEHREQVAELKPNFSLIEKLDGRAMIVTAPDDEVDFVSRYFAPKIGVPEDPVTGSAHCTLIPYWSKRLGKTKMSALQLSARGGRVFCEFRGERVQIGGRAVTYLEGKIFIP
jgi:PhzF family phenazine biosynthesis protein